MPTFSFEEATAPKGSFSYEDASAPVNRTKRIDTDEPLSFMERLAQHLPGSWGAGNIRGSAVGRVAMGAADPGVALAQLAANAVGQGDSVNRGIADTEKDYQNARNEAGNTGFDPLRLAGNVAITAPLGAIGGVPQSLLGAVGKGAATGAGFGALEPVTDGSFWENKAKQVAIGGAGGAAMAPLAAGLARIVSPNTSANVKLLQQEGIHPTLGQTLGGNANKLEERAQSLPLVGDLIANARNRAQDEFRAAAIDRAAAPIGETIGSRGSAAIGELSDKLGKAYDKVLPQLAVDVMDPNFLGKLSTVRQMVQSLPEKERNHFDAVLSREIDNRIAPNGVLSGQNLKDAWIAFREAGTSFSKSTDPFHRDLGNSFKQVLQELKDHVSNTNPQPLVQDLKNADLGYANFKRLQRAASSVGAEEGSFTPAQLQNAVKAMDTSKDKARFAKGDALMQDLSTAGKSVLSNKVPNSGTPERMMIAGLLGGSVAAPSSIPLVAGAVAGTALAYTPKVQNMLAALVSKRPDLAPEVANYIRQLQLGAVGVPLLEQQ